MKTSWANGSDKIAAIILAVCAVGLVLGIIGWMLSTAS